MSRRGLRDRVELAALGVQHGAVQQQAEPAGELPAVAVEVVGAELVHRQQHHEGDVAVLGGKGSGQEEPAGEQERAE